MSEDHLDQAAQTVTEHVAAAGLGVRARPSRPAALDPDVREGACTNCATQLAGPVCHVCGQIADTYHRPFISLVGQVLEGLLHLDGRIARTVPSLMVQPGEVTRTYLKGARARFIPPFRLYLGASLAFFLLVTLMNGNAEWRVEAPGGDFRTSLESALSEADMDPGERERLLAALDRAQGAPAPASEDTRAAGQDEAAGDAEQTGMAPADMPEVRLSLGHAGLERFFATRFEQVRDDPERWLDATLAWIPRVLFVLVPVYAGLLALSFSWRRGYFFYDHLIVSLHFHAALFVSMTLAVLAAPIVGAGFAIAAVLVYSNLYLYRLHRRVYARSRLTSVLRVIALDTVYFFVMILALIAVILLGLMSA